MDVMLATGSFVLAVLALFVSVRSWQAADQSARAAIYAQRFEIYSDAEAFISAWMRDGTPDLSLLSRLVGAWSRSHFLSRAEVTAYLRELWTNAVDASYARKIMQDKAKGDYGSAAEKEHNLLMKHADFDRLREVFMHDLKVHYR